MIKVFFYDKHFAIDKLANMEKPINMFFICLSRITAVIRSRDCCPEKLFSVASLGLLLHCKIW